MSDTLKKVISYIGKLGLRKLDAIIDVAKTASADFQICSTSIDTDPISVKNTGYNLDVRSHFILDGDAAFIVWISSGIYWSREIAPPDSDIFGITIDPDDVTDFA
jgi:hypothetical protein